MILFGLIIIVIGIAIVINKKHPGTRKYMNYVMKTRWMLGAYFAVLLISVGVFFALPKSEDLSTKEVDPNEITSPPLFKAAHLGDIERLNQYKKKTWEYKMQGNSIQLEAPFGSTLSVFVETEKTQGNMIDVAYYQMPAIVNGMYVADKANPPHVEFSSDIMTLSDPERAVVELMMFKKEFPILQFTGEKWLEHHSDYIDSQLLYVRVPENIEVNVGSEVIISFVGKDEAL